MAGIGREARGRPDLVAEAAIALDKFRGELGEEDELSSTARICPSQAGEPPIPIVGTATAPVSSRATLSATSSMTSANAPASAIATVAHDLVVLETLI